MGEYYVVGTYYSHIQLQEAEATDLCTLSGKQLLRPLSEPRLVKNFGRLKRLRAGLGLLSVRYLKVPYGKSREGGGPLNMAGS